MIRHAKTASERVAAGADVVGGPDWNAAHDFTRIAIPLGDVAAGLFRPQSGPLVTRAWGDSVAGLMEFGGLAPATAVGNIVSPDPDAGGFSHSTDQLRLRFDRRDYVSAATTAGTRIARSSTAQMRAEGPIYSLSRFAPYNLSAANALFFVGFHPDLNGPATMPTPAPSNAWGFSFDPADNTIGFVANGVREVFGSLDSSSVYDAHMCVSDGGADLIWFLQDKRGPNWSGVATGFYNVAMRYGFVGQSRAVGTFSVSVMFHLLETVY